MDTISVIIPLYSAEKYIVEALESVFNQTVKPTEVIVIDDASADKSVAMLERYMPRIRFFQHDDNKGAAAARNTGLKQARGSMIAFLDADDVWSSDALECLLNGFQNHTEAEIVFGESEQFIDDDVEKLSESPEQAKETLKQGFLVGSCLIRKDVFDKVGCLDESLVVGEFIDWFNRAKDYNISYVTIPKKVHKRRIHPFNREKLRQRQNASKDYLKMIRASLKRRREL